MTVLFDLRVAIITEVKYVLPTLLIYVYTRNIYIRLSLNFNAKIFRGRMEIQACCRYNCVPWLCPNHNRLMVSSLKCSSSELINPLETGTTLLCG